MLPYYIYTYNVRKKVKTKSITQINNDIIEKTNDVQIRYIYLSRNIFYNNIIIKKIYVSCNRKFPKKYIYEPSILKLK